MAKEKRRLGYPARTSRALEDGYSLHGGESSDGHKHHTCTPFTTYIRAKNISMSMYYRGLNNNIPILITPLCSLIIVKACEAVALNT